jgi:hypothetical protein
MKKIKIPMLFVISSLLFSSIASAKIYEPGETLEPDCAPGAPNCGVASFPTHATSTTFFSSIFSGNNLRIENATTTNFFATNNFFTTNMAAANMSGSSLVIDNATTTNLFAANLMSDNATLENLIFTNATGTSATTTNLYATNFTTDNLKANSISTSGLAAFDNLLVNGSSTLQDFTFNNATGTALSTARLFTNNFSSDNASTTNLSAGNLSAGNLSAENASTTNLFSSSLRSDDANFEDLVFNRAVGTSATTTNFYSTNTSAANLFFVSASGGNFTSSGTGSFANLIATDSSNFQDLTFTKATGTSVTTTNLFSENLTSNNGMLTRLTAANATTTSLFSNDFFAGNSTTTNMFSNSLIAGNASSTNFFFNAANGGNLTSSGLGTFGNLLSNGSTTLQTLTFTDANADSLNITNIVSDNLSAADASFTNLSSSALNVGDDALVVDSSDNVFIGNGLDTVSIDTATWDLDAAGELTGLSGIAVEQGAFTDIYTTNIFGNDSTSLNISAADGGDIVIIPGAPSGNGMSGRMMVEGDTIIDGNSTTTGSASMNKLSIAGGGLRLETITSCHNLSTDSSGNVVCELSQFDVNIRKSANQSSATVILENDTELVFPIGANETWVFRFDLLYSTGATTDIQIAVNAPAGAACDYAFGQYSAGYSLGTNVCGEPLPVEDTAPVIYQALPLTGSITNGSTAGTVRLQFAKNSPNLAPATIHRGSSLSAFRASSVEVDMSPTPLENFDLGAIDPTDPDESDNGLTALVASIQTEIVHDPIALIGAKIAEGRQFMTDFVAARVTAIRGYFDELFARKIHTQEICVKKSDGAEACITGDELNSLLEYADITPIIAEPVADDPAIEPGPAASSTEPAIPLDNSEDDIEELPVELPTETPIETSGEIIPSVEMTPAAEEAPEISVPDAPQA